MKNFFYYLLFLALGSAPFTGCHPVLAQTSPASYLTLEQRRPELDLPILSAEEKSTVLDQVEIVLNDLFVHKLLKFETFGSATLSAPVIAYLRSQVSSITDADFQAALLKLFAEQRDLHTQYTMPTPFSCYRTFLPFTLGLYKDTEGHDQIGVASVMNQIEVLNLAPEAQKISVGDTLLTYDGDLALNAAKRFELQGMGANPAAALRRAVQNMYFWSQRNTLPLAKNKISLSFKNRIGEVYSLEIPYLNRLNQQCYSGANRKRTISPKNFMLGQDDQLIEIQKLFRQASRKRAKALLPTDEPILSYKIFDNEYGKYGLLKLESFVPEAKGTEGTLNIIKSLLSQEMKSTDGLIIDLRDNGGGWIDMAESMIQMFSPERTQPLGFRLLNSPTNQFLGKNKFQFLNSRFQRVLERAELLNASYTEAIPLNSEKGINQKGQFYYKPVAILTNSACYSSCDVATALFMDSTQAIVYTEDGTTGGGGANNVQHAAILDGLKNISGHAFKPLPKGTEIGFAWRQMLRSGRGLGALIENTGVPGHYVLPRSLGDFFSEDSQQLRQITQKLSSLSAQQNSSVNFVSEKRYDVPVGKTLQVPLAWKNTSAIEMVKEGESLALFKTQSPSSFEGTTSFLSFPDSQTPRSLLIGHVELYGYNNGKKVWRKIFNYRSIPDQMALANEEKIELGSPLFATQINVYNDGNLPADGWNLMQTKPSDPSNNDPSTVPATGQQLVIGSGSGYNDSVKTEASFFLSGFTGQSTGGASANNQLRGQLKLTLSAKGKTEKDYDFFTVKVIDEEGEHTLISLSGGIDLNEAVYDLNAYAGKPLEIRLQFESDMGVMDQGIVITKLVIE